MNTSRAVVVVTLFSFFPLGQSSNSQASNVKNQKLELSVHLLKGKDSGFLCHLSCSLSYWNLDSRLFLQNINERQFSSVQFSRSVMSYSLWPCELQHARPPCPSPTPGVHPNSCPSSQWCHPTISSSVVHFSSCPQSFRASGSFPVSQLFTSGGQSIRVSASGEYSMNIQDCISFRMDWLDLLAVQGTLKSLLQHHNSKASILRHSAFFIVQLAHPYMTIGKTIALTRRRQSGNFTPQHLGWEQQRKEYCEIVSCMDYFNENNRGIYF